MSPSPTNLFRGAAKKVRGAVSADHLDIGPIESGLFDPWYYGLQTGLDLTPREALDHYVREGAAAGLLPNPLTDFGASGLSSAEAVAAVVDGSARELPVRSFFDAPGLIDLAPEAADHPGGPVGFYLQHAHAGAPVPPLGRRTWSKFVHLRGQQVAALEVILSAGVVDRPYYEAQAQRSFIDDRQAVWHFLEEGESAALTLSPLYDRSWYRSKAGVRMPMTFMHFLRTGQVAGAAGPHFDAATYVASVPGAVEHPGGPLGHFLAHAGPSTVTVPERDSGVQPATWGSLRDLLLAASRTGRQDDGCDAVPPSPRVPGRVSVLVVSQGDRHRTRRTVEQVLERSDGDLEIVVVENGSPRESAAILIACFAGEPRVRIERLSELSSRAVAGGRALAVSTGEMVVFLDPDVEVRPGWLPPLVEAIGRSDVLAAQPLLLTADDTIRSAGLVSAGRQVVPVPLLAGHPVEDLPPGDVLEPDAVSGACLIARAELLESVGGPDPAYNDLAEVDLSLRLAEARDGRFLTVTSSRVSRRSRQPLPDASEADQLRLIDRWGGRLPAARVEPWRLAGFEVDAFSAGPGLPESLRRTSATPVLRRRKRLVVDGPGAGLPSLRWAVKIAAGGGLSGDRWGDTYFAADLVRGLQAWGQEAFVDRRGAHQRPGVDHLDDVTVTLRGRWPAVTQPGATNVLWVISHPDEVPLDELTQGFDLVYAAGRTWAAEASAATSSRIRTLLQATDASRFTPDGDVMEGLGTLFVGRTRKVMRDIVRDALAVGADLTIFGDGWEQFIDPSHVAADHLPGDRVPAAYRGARIVLNDHWADMARLGFYSNRLFDAVASGARVISDPVDGIEDVLGTSVRTYRTLAELGELLDPASPLWPEDAELAANAAQVAARHTFLARAEVLLADVLDARGVEHALNGSS